MPEAPINPLAEAQAAADNSAARAEAIRDRYLAGASGALPDSVVRGLAEANGPLKVQLDPDLQPWAAAFDDFPVTVDLLLQIQIARLLRRIADVGNGPAKPA